PDARWRLFAWLEETQPTLPLGPETFYPSYLLTVLLDTLDPGDPQAALLALAREAQESERAYLLDMVEKQVDAAEERLDEQIKAKRAEAELLLEAFENAAEEASKPIDARAAYGAVSEALDRKS